MSWTIIITLIAVGIVLVLLEIFLIPGFISGVIGMIAIIVGVYQAYKTYGSTSGHITLSIVIAFVVFLMILLFRSGTWRRVSLAYSINSKVNVIEENKVKKGDTGQVIARLQPAGKAEINGDTYEVHSLAGIIEVGTKIKVSKVEGYKIFVEPLKS